MQSADRVSGVADEADGLHVAVVGALADPDESCVLCELERRAGHWRYWAQE